jgi:hypothetical protein
MHPGYDASNRSQSYSDGSKRQAMNQFTLRLARTSVLALAFASAAFSMAQMNVAASANGGVASQSSVYTPDNTAEKGNDGNRDGRYDSLSMMHTQYESEAWYKVNFATPTTISQVNVFNRTDSFSERLSPFTVSLSLNGNVVWSASNQSFIQNINDGNPFVAGMSFTTNSVLADSVMVKLDRTEWLHLAELEAVSAVPEPATMTALIAGTAMLIRRRKRSKSC